MSFDLEKIWASKRALRRQLIALPIAKKLEMLDALHERALAIKNSRSVLESQNPPKAGFAVANLQPATPQSAPTIDMSKIDDAPSR